MKRAITTIAILAAVATAPVQATGFRPWARDDVPTATVSESSALQVTSFYSSGLPQPTISQAGGSSDLVITPWYRSAQ